ncbi:MAG: hypothetical protein EA375_00025 [Acholeplasmataceae bacterium]|nr:MAG: hypothetical protein EA375_00025 [Acholeplasmataceae bacterium]
MRRRILLLAVFAVFGLLLSACWPAEVGVETTFTNSRGAGTRVIIIDIMDDTLSVDPIPNPEDPDGTKGKGAVINNKHITGGLMAIQTWLEENAPSWMTIEPVEVDGIHRYFKMSYSFDDFEDFMAKYEELVNMSPTMSWDDFDADELPSWTVVTEGNQKIVTYTESHVILLASLDWAVDGIWNDLYDADDLAGWVDKVDIWALANYTVTIGEAVYEELRYYDEDRPDGENFGKIVFVESEDFELESAFDAAVLPGCCTTEPAYGVIGGILFALTLSFGLMVLVFKKPV